MLSCVKNLIKCEDYVKLITVYTPIRVLSDNGPMRVELARWRERLVVVKSLQQHSPFLAQRLKREGDVVKKLRHDNIVPLLNSEEGRLIYAYSPGVNLAEAIEGHPLQLQRSLKIIGDVLSALSYAHANNVIHCDVKPANILVKGDKAMLTDFGFAKDLALTAITDQNVFLGTPNYMSPEQFKGVRDDPRGDLYAAGAVLYSMLSGTPPYGGQVIRFLLGDESAPLDPLPPAARPVNDIILKAIRFNPDARYQTADEMLRDLNAVLESLTAPQPNTA